MSTLEQLRIFVHVARHRNVTRAAKALKISQPSVSRHLKSLEAGVSAKLFRKTNTGVELTAPGRRCLTHAEAILRQLKRMENDVLDDPSEVKKPLTVAGTYSASAFLLPAVIAEFKLAYEPIEVRLRTANRRSVEEMVLSAHVDLAVITAGSRSPGLVSEPFRRQDLVFFASRRHPAAAARHLTPHDLEDFPLIVRDSYDGGGTADRILDQLIRRGLQPHVALRCDSPDSVKAAVKNRLGLGLLYRDVIEPEVKEGKFKIIPIKGINFLGRSFIIYRDGKSLSESAASFLTLLRAWRRKRFV